MPYEPTAADIDPASLQDPTLAMEADGDQSLPRGFSDDEFNADQVRAVIAQFELQRLQPLGDAPRAVLSAAERSGTIRPAEFGQSCSIALFGVRAHAQTSERAAERWIGNARQRLIRGAA